MTNKTATELLKDAVISNIKKIDAIKKRDEAPGISQEQFMKANTEINNCDNEEARLINTLAEKAAASREDQKELEHSILKFDLKSLPYNEETIKKSLLYIEDQIFGFDLIRRLHAKGDKERLKELEGDYKINDALIAETYANVKPVGERLVSDDEIMADMENVKTLFLLAIQYKVEEEKNMQALKENPQKGEKLFNAASKLKKQWSDELEDIMKKEKLSTDEVIMRPPEEAKTIAANGMIDPKRSEMIDEVLQSITMADFSEPEQIYAQKAIESTKLEVSAIRNRRSIASKAVQTHAKSQGM